MLVLFKVLGFFVLFLFQVVVGFGFVFFSPWTPYLCFNKIKDLFPAFHIYWENWQDCCWLKKTFKRILKSLMHQKQWDMFKHSSSLGSSISLLLLHWWKSWNWWRVQIFMVRSRKFFFFYFKTYSCLQIHHLMYMFLRVEAVWCSKSSPNCCLGHTSTCAS